MACNYSGRRTLFTLILIVLTASTPSCSLLKPVKTKPAETYALTDAGHGQRAQRAHGATVVLVSTPSAAPGYDTADMIYTKNRYQFDHFSTHKWRAPPAEMLQPLLVKSLQNSGCFATVASAPYSGVSDITLSTQLLALHQEFLGNRSQERMDIDVTLLDSNSNQALASQRFSCVIPATADPYGGVIAANEATAELMDRISAFVCRHKK